MSSTCSTWSSTNAESGDLPDEPLDAVRLAYALAARYDSMVASERMWGFEHRGTHVALMKVHADMVEKTGREGTERGFERVRRVQDDPRGSDVSRCPVCGLPGVPVVYGLPGSDLAEAERRGLLVLGGCEPHEEAWACPNDHRWRP